MITQRRKEEPPTSSSCTAAVSFNDDGGWFNRLDDDFHIKYTADKAHNRYQGEL